MREAPSTLCWVSVDACGGLVTVPAAAMWQEPDEQDALRQLATLVPDDKVGLMEGET